MSSAEPLATAPQTLSPPRPAAGLSTLAGPVVAITAYLLSVALLLASRVREFADESDNLLGGYLIARGERLYADYFSNHMPLPYYLAAVPSLLGATTIDQFRVFTDTLLVVTTIAIAWALIYKRGLPWKVAAAWAALTVFAHTVQWGEMLHAGTCAGFGLLAAGLLFYTTPGLRFSFRDQLALAAAAFVAIQSELLSIYPLALLAVCYLASRPSPRAAARLALLVTIPHLVVVLGFAAVGALGAFIYDAYQFNQTYYAQFVMNGSILGMLHDWEAQYRTYVLTSLRNPLSLEGCLVLANLAATAVVYRARGPLPALAYILFVSLTRVRNGGPYYLASYFSLALLLSWALASLSRASSGRSSTERSAMSRVGLSGGSRAERSGPLDARGVPQRVGWQAFEMALNRRAALLGRLSGGSRAERSGPLGEGASSLRTLLAVTALGLIATFLYQVARTYDFSKTPAYQAPEPAKIQAVTQPGDRIFVAPYDPYLYLASARLPASTYEFYFPWQATDPHSDAQIMSELRQRRPAAIVFHEDELVNGQYLTRDYATHLQQLLTEEAYARLPDSDVFVPAERLTAAAR